MSWIQTYSGQAFWFESPNSSISPLDIATALSRLARFNGHTTEFYSVAQHSVLVSLCVKDLGGTLEEQLWGLLHDAAEAYLGDLSSPLKHLPCMSGFRELEDRVMGQIVERFRLFPSAQPEVVSKADRMMLAAEKQQLMTPCVLDWGIEEDPSPNRIIPLAMGAARHGFMDRLSSLLIQRAKA